MLLYIPTDKELESYFYRQHEYLVEELDSDNIQEMIDRLKICLIESFKNTILYQSNSDKSNVLHIDLEAVKTVERPESSENCNDAQTHHNNDVNVQD